MKVVFMVKADLINPFFKAAIKIINEMTNVEVSKGELSLAYSPVKGDKVNTTIGVTGDLLGQIILCMSEKAAMVLSTNMLFGLEVSIFDELSRSAICELANIITGTAISELGDMGLICHITPPTLFMGKEVVVSAKNLGFLIIPLLSGIGDIKICIALMEARNRR